jgi:uncharacterized iron-regulated protein
MKMIERRYGLLSLSCLLAGGAWSSHATYGAERMSVGADEVEVAVCRALVEADVILLGEVHDNRGQHARRVAWLRDALPRRRVVLAMEQFDVDRQPWIDQARIAGLPARGLAEQAAFSFDGWDWPSYAPAVQLALDRDWPLMAANLPAREAMTVARRPTQAPSAPPGWGSSDDAAMAEEIRDGHCGLMPDEMLPTMVAAQRARDARMAQVVADARAVTGLPVVLLAGNGHVRRDLGVPRWLAALRPGDQMVAVGMLEGDAADGGRYDLVVRTESVSREDPCEALRRRIPAR